MKEYKKYKYNEYNGKWAIFTEEEKPWVVDFNTEEACIAWIDETVEANEKAKEEQATIENLNEQLTELQLAFAEYVEGGNE